MMQTTKRIDLDFISDGDDANIPVTQIVTQYITKKVTKIITNNVISFVTLIKI
jgi:hypothetical protein